MRIFRYYKDLLSQADRRINHLTVNSKSKRPSHIKNSLDNSRSNRMSYFKNSSDISWIAPPSNMGTGNGWFTPADISQHRDIVFIQLLNIMKTKLQARSKIAYFKLKLNKFRVRKSERILSGLEKLIPITDPTARSIDLSLSGIGNKLFNTSSIIRAGNSTQAVSDINSCSIP